MRISFPKTILNQDNSYTNLLQSIYIDGRKYKTKDDFIAYLKQAINYNIRMQTSSSYVDGIQYSYSDLYGTNFSGSWYGKSGVLSQPIFETKIVSVDMFFPNYLFLKIHKPTTGPFGIKIELNGYATSTSSPTIIDLFNYGTYQSYQAFINTVKELNSEYFNNTLTDFKSKNLQYWSIRLYIYYGYIVWKSGNTYTNVYTDPLYIDKFIIGFNN